MPARRSTLDLVIEHPNPNYPKVRLLIDGVDRLDPERQEEGNDPADILDTGALVPQTEPRRIALYGCGCGTFGCSVVAGLVSETAGLVSWTDFRTLTGAYHSALPEPEDRPDPARVLDEQPVGGAAPELVYFGRTLDLPDVHFEAEHYHSVVNAAMRDRSWESRTRAVLRHVRDRLPDRHLYASRNGDAITLSHRTPGEKWAAVDVTLDVPPGSAVAVADHLVALLEEHRDPRDIARLRLWR